MNALAGEDVAIVTPVAGTTRDRLKETIQLDGVPLHIIDTAGLRETTDSVEQIGIERTWKAITQADLVLHLLDASKQQNLSDIDQELLVKIKKELPSTVPVKIIWNKIDQAEIKPAASSDEWLVSAKTGEGLDLLKAELLRVAGWQPEAEGGILARKRHLEALAEAESFIQNALAQLNNGSSFIELAAEEMRLAQDALSKITGEFLPDDLLGKIFSTFCIGK
jgi:tRNA modification GTPase